MQIAISSPRFSFENCSEIIRREFPGWEIVADGRYSVLEMERMERDDLPQEIYIGIHGPIGYVNIGALEEPFRRLSQEYIKALIEIMQRLELEDLVIHPGYVPQGYWGCREKVAKITMKSLRELTKFAREYGVRIYLENFPKAEFFTFYSPSELLSAAKELEIDICLDIGHAFIGGMLPSFLKERELREYVTRAHVHDNDGKRDLHLPPGRGKINFEVLREFKKIKTYVLEVNSIEDAYEAYSWIVEWLRKRPQQIDVRELLRKISVFENSSRLFQ